MMGEGGSGSLRDGSEIEGRALCFFRQQTTSFVNLCLGTSPLDAFCLIYILGGVCAAAGRTIRLSVGDWVEEMLAGHIHGSWRAKQVQRVNT